jgi:hypothetical protein
MFISPEIYLERKELSPGEKLFLDYANDVVFTHGQQFLTVDLEGLTGVFAEQNAITDLHVHRKQLAVVTDFAVANGNDFALIRLFGSGIGNNDSGCSLGFSFQTLDDDTVAQGTNLHAYSPKFSELTNCGSGELALPACDC